MDSDEGKLFVGGIAWDTTLMAERLKHVGFHTYNVVDIRNPCGIAKVLGTLISLAGVMTMTLYKGPIMRNIGKAPIHIGGDSATHESWLKGSILTVSSCITWSIWYIMQGIVVSGLIVFIQLWCKEEKGPVS